MTKHNDSTCAPLVKYAIVAEDPRYRVGDDGSAWSRIKVGRHGGYEVTWRRLKPSKGSQYGHLRVELGRKVYRFVHRLVLEAFVGPCPEGLECLHDDGDPTNNRLDNLKWGTRKENHADSVRHGTAFLSGREPRLGEDHPYAKLTEDIVRAIMVERLRSGGGVKSISVVLGLPESLRGAVNGVICGQAWNHVTGLPPYKPRSNRPGRRRKVTSDNSLKNLDVDSTQVVSAEPPCPPQPSDFVHYVSRDLFPV